MYLIDLTPIDLSRRYRYAYGRYAFGDCATTVPNAPRAAATSSGAVPAPVLEGCQVSGPGVQPSASSDIGAGAPLPHDVALGSRPRSSGQRCGQRVWRWLLALRRKPPRAFLFRYLASLRAEYVFHIFHMRSIYRHVYSYSGGVSTRGSGRTSCAWERGRVLGLKRFDFPEIRFDFAAYTRRRLLFPRNPELRTRNTDCCSNI